MTRLAASRRGHVAGTYYGAGRSAAAGRQRPCRRRALGRDRPAGRRRPGRPRPPASARPQRRARAAHRGRRKPPVGRLDGRSGRNGRTLQRGDLLALGRVRRSGRCCGGATDHHRGRECCVHHPGLRLRHHLDPRPFRPGMGRNGCWDGNGPVTGACRHLWRSVLPQPAATSAAAMACRWRLGAGEISAGSGVGMVPKHGRGDASASRRSGSRPARRARRWHNRNTERPGSARGTSPNGRPAPCRHRRAGGTRARSQ